MRWISMALGFLLIGNLWAEDSKHDRVSVASQAEHRWQVTGSGTVTPFDAPAWLVDGTFTLRYEYADFVSGWVATGAQGETGDGREWIWAAEPWSLGLGLRRTSPFRWQAGLGWTNATEERPARISLQGGVSVMSDPVVMGWTGALVRPWSSEPDTPWLVRTGVSLREVLNDRVSMAIETGWAGVLRDGSVVSSLQISWTWSWQEEAWGGTSTVASGTGSPWSWGGSLDWEGRWPPR